MASLSSAFIFFTVCISQPNVAASADHTRAGRPLVAASWVHTRDVKKSLSDVMDDALSHEHQKAKEVRVDRLTEVLRPTFTALPKNRHGYLGHAAVRYALHRHFVHKHGMYVKGFEPAGEAWNSSSPVDILEDKVPTYVQHLFEERLHDGFDLKELALLAATLEHFVHLEQIERLKGAYRLAGVPVDKDITAERLEGVMDRYAFLQLIGGDHETMNRDTFERHFKGAAQIFPEWPETQSFLREVLENSLENEQGGEKGPHGELVSFAAASNIVEVAGMRYGRFQDGGCRSLEKELAAKEDKGTGRVKLSDFYQAGWNFRESQDYLRSLGALDESGDMPKVVIPNYILSKTNCVGSSSMYSLCCIDQCEELLGHLERRIAAPESTPEKIAEIVSALPSASVQAPRQLSAAHVKRLQEIADGNRGRVPLHGRLFGQWMHHAYPRECPFPVTSGSSKPMTADDWLKETNTTIIATDEDIQALSERAKETESQMEVKDLADGDLEETLPWLAEEELVVHRPRPSMMHEFAVIGKALAFVAVLFSLTLKLMQMSTKASKLVHSSDAKV